MEAWLDVKNVKHDVSRLGEMKPDDGIRCEVIGQGVIWYDIMESDIA